MDSLKKVDDSSYKSGTTIVSLKGDNFCILASDRQGSLGNFAYDLNAKKVYELNDRVAIGLAGTLGDAQQVIRLMKAEINLYESERNKKMSTKAIATFLSNYLNANRYYPYFAGFIMAGYDKEGKAYSTDVIGGFGEVYDFTSIGSGSTFATGVLERGFFKGISEAEAVELVADSIKASRKRDVFSGGSGIDIFVIKESGIEKITK